MAIQRQVRRWVTVAVLALAVVAEGTTVRPLTVTCPVCGHEVESAFVGSTNNFEGQDADFFKRAAGFIPRFVLATTCPRCRYSAFPDDFKTAPDGLSPAVREKILGGKALVVPAVPEWAPKPAEGKLPAWARLDLIAQTKQLEGRTASELGDAWQHCSWGVRIEANPFGAVFDEFPVELATAERDPDRNPSEVDIEFALALLAKLPSLAKPLQRPAAAGVGYLLRTRGEHVALLAALPVLEPYFTQAEWAGLEPRVKASIEFERGYQRKSLAAFERALEGPMAKASDRAEITYLTGELARRLGEPEKACDRFGMSLAVKGGPDWLKKMVKRGERAVDRDWPPPK